MAHLERDALEPGRRVSDTGPGIENGARDLRGASADRGLQGQAGHRETREAERERQKTQGVHRGRALDTRAQRLDRRSGHRPLAAERAKRHDRPAHGEAARAQAGGHDHPLCQGRFRRRGGLPGVAAVPFADHGLLVGNVHVPANGGGLGDHRGHFGTDDVNAVRHGR